MGHKVNFEDLQNKSFEAEFLSHMDHDGMKSILFAIDFIGGYEIVQYKVEWRYARAEQESTTFNSLFNAVNFYNDL